MSLFVLKRWLNAVETGGVEIYNLSLVRDSSFHVSFFLLIYLFLDSYSIAQKVVPLVRLVVYSHGLGGLVREGLKGPSYQCLRP